MEDTDGASVMSSDTTLNEEERAMRSLSPAEGFFTPLQTPNASSAQQELGSQNVTIQDQTPMPKKKPKKKKKKSSAATATADPQESIAPRNPGDLPLTQPPAILPNGSPGFPAPPTPPTPSLPFQSTYSSYMDDYRQKVKDPDHYYAKEDQRMAAKVAKEAAEKAAGTYKPLEKVTDVASYYSLVDRFEAGLDLEDEIESEIDANELKSPLSVSVP